jgi:hypothetical protein
MFRSIDGIRAANKSAGLFWFSPNTMRFFNTRICGPLHGGRFFVTSDRISPRDGIRRYTVRVAHRDGSVSTVPGTVGGEPWAIGHYAAALAARKTAARLGIDYPQDGCPCSKCDNIPDAATWRLPVKLRKQLVCTDGPDEIRVWRGDDCILSITKSRRATRFFRLASASCQVPAGLWTRPLTGIEDAASAVFPADRFAISWEEE